MREKNVRDGYVSTVQIWMGRQRLVTCRAAYIHARVVPARDRKEADRFDAEVEALAVQIAAAYEARSGAKVKDVSRPAQARQAGLSDWPGFDLLSDHPDGERRCIEVKGPAAGGSGEVIDNERAKACNLGDQFWLYVVYDRATPRPA